MAGGSGIAASTCEFFDCVRNKWTTVAPLNTQRKHARAAAFADTVFIFGGSNSRNPNRHLGDVEQYDHATNKWTVLGDRLSTARYNFAAACVDGRIYIVGGETKNTFLSSVECFDPVEKRFSHVSPFSKPNCGLAAASVFVSASVLKRLFE